MYKLPTLFAVLSFLALQSSAQTKPIVGFTHENSASQIKNETAFDKNLSAQRICEFIKEFSSKPHELGSLNGKEVAEKVQKRWNSYGINTKIETYTVLFPTPKTRVLEMTGPTKYTAVLKEPALKEDGTSNQAEQLPIYNAWSADGDVTGELVFVNFGMPQDYEELDKLGISVKGKIVIARYGRSWRGIKPKVAQEHGALGCIIYSDPKEDGYYEGDVYPKGAYKNEFGAQRGSVMDMVIYPGDPLTPNAGATKNAKRLERLKAPNLLKIPVLPISYHDAQPLLSALEGPVAPPDWRGALPITYHIGPGKTTVHLKLTFDWKQVPAYDVIGKIKGSEFPDEWVIRGNHHDAWVNGAADPISGLAALNEEARSIGLLVKSGWKPKRTLVFCAWDGEEPGLLGSTEWAEDHGKELQQKAVVYINSDGNGRGFLGVGGSHALEPLMDEIAKTVIDPQTKASVYDRMKAAQAVNAENTKAKKDVLDSKEMKLSALGSGSDYSSFLQHLGVPSLNLGFGGEDEGGEYHSIYDSYDLYRRFKDPTFEYGVALSKTAGRAMLRLSEADVLPFDFTHLYKTVNTYTDELMKLLEAQREATDIENRMIAANDFKLAFDPEKKWQLPKAKSAVPFIDFSSLQNALKKLQISSDSLASRLAKNSGKNGSVQINCKLYQAEQQLLLADGLPRRGWYKHSLYAPGFYTGYGVKTMPGIREAIEQREYKEASEQIKRVAGALNKLAVYLDGVK